MKKIPYSLLYPVPFYESEYSLLLLCVPPMKKHGAYGHNLLNVTLGQ